MPKSQRIEVEGRTGTYYGCADCGQTMNWDNGLRPNRKFCDPLCCLYVLNNNVGPASKIIWKGEAVKQAMIWAHREMERRPVQAARDRQRAMAKRSGQTQKAGEVMVQEDWGGKCEVCGQSPVISATGLCGPCTFGTADALP